MFYFLSFLSFICLLRILTCRVLGVYPSLVGVIMSSESSSEQSCVREGAGYDKVYPLGQDDLGTSYPKRVPSANSPFEEDSEVDGSESGSSEDLNG